MGATINVGVPQVTFTVTDIVSVNNSGPSMVITPLYVPTPRNARLLQFSETARLVGVVLKVPDDGDTLIHAVEGVAVNDLVPLLRKKVLC